MSFLNSVLSSINTGKGEISSPSVTAVSKREGPATSARDNATSTKRKASAELPRSTEKLARNTAGETIVPTSSKPSSARANPPSTTRANPPFNAAARKVANPESARPPTESKSAPKKGSLKEILARAKQNSTMQVGQLTHKPKEKVSIKKELAYQREMAKKGKKGAQPQTTKGVQTGKNGIPVPSGSSKNKHISGKDVVAGPQKGTAKIKSHSTYQGTANAKPSQPTYRGTMVSREAPSKRGYDSEPGRERSKPNQTRRGGYSDFDSDEGSGSEDGYDYASEDYSDMDAGFDDVDEEEAMAEREAKKEDVREQRMLEELARQKEERKRRAALAAEREKARGRS